MRELRGKAGNLTKLAAAGLRVPPWFVVGEGERVDAAEAAKLGDWLAVRSSADVEDGDEASAAGVFASVLDVRPRDVERAVDEVRASATTPAARAYAKGRVEMTVIVQRMVDGVPVTVYTRPPGRPDADEAWLQRGGELTKVARDDASAAIAIALAAERAIGATRGADVELVAPRDGEPWIVQARPIVHRAPVELAAPPDELLEPLRDGRTWTWDVAHNPDPLSLAQQGLVARVARFGEYELRVCAGYLYTTPRARPSEPPRNVAAYVKLAQQSVQRLAEIARFTPSTLEDALAGYLAFYGTWAHVNAILAKLPRKAASRPSAVENTLLRAARGELAEAQVIEELGDLSPAWDVAAPTYGEHPQRIRDAIARVREHGDEPAAAPDEIADLRERDDLYFARAQAIVRRAILARAAELGVAADDAFHVPLAELVAGRVTSAPAVATPYAMPLVVGPHAATSAPRAALHGHGSGGRAAGRVVRYASLGTAIAARRGDIVVTRAVTPALAVLVVGCAALVSETGGPLDHGAALARELGIPCVVGCHDAFGQLLDGTLVLVDGARGTVEKL